MACPKCGENTIVVTDEERAGFMGRFCGGMAFMALGGYLMAIPLLGLFFVMGGLMYMCGLGNKIKVIKCTNCNYRKENSK